MLLKLEYEILKWKETSHMEQANTMMTKTDNDDGNDNDKLL